MRISTAPGFKAAENIIAHDEQEAAFRCPKHVLPNASPERSSSRHGPVSAFHEQQGAV